MSINHFHRGTDLEETPWWQQQQSIMETPPPPPPPQNSSGSSSSPKIQTTNPQQQFSSWPNSPHQFHHHQLWLNSSNSNNNNNINDDHSNSHYPTLSSFNEEQHMTNTNEEHEPMFEKPLTPSDVGKLNRLVIPKQHAEKYFPLGGDSHSGSDKGLLLSFEDESGKCWRFRYSYWNSSQSYVLTKGWSRYVKEKRLDAGDVILFERHRSESERLFIRWRRRGSMTAQDEHSIGAASGGWPRAGGLYSNQPYPVVTVPLYQHQHAGSMVQSQTTSVGNSRTLRLFGVNLECQLDDSEGSELVHQQINYSEEAYNSTDRHNHMDMDITFSRENENQIMRNRQG